MDAKMDPKEMIAKLMDDAKATEDVRKLAPLMGRQLLIQLACPIAVFGNDAKPTGFANITQGVIQPSELSDRVFILIPGNMMALVKAIDVQIAYVPMPQEERRIITSH
jgi:hypothetical protein